MDPIPNPRDRTRTSEESAGGTRGLTTGTTTVGLAGADGVVLAADARASLAGRFVTNRSMRKVESVGDGAAVAFSGGVGDAQGFVRTLRAQRRLYELRHDRPPAAGTLASVAAERTRSGRFPSLWLLLGGLDDDPAVYEIDPAGGVMATEYAAGGSGMQLAYGALERSYEPGLDLDALRSVAAEALAGAAERDAASGDGMTLATITEDGTAIETCDELGARALEAVAGDAAGATDEEVA